MRDLLKAILEKYPAARKSTSFGGQHEIRSLFEQLKDEVSDLQFIKSNPNLLVKYSYGKGNWAETPWIAILDKRETTTPQKETYVVILFRSDYNSSGSPPLVNDCTSGPGVYTEKWQNC